MKPVLTEADFGRAAAAIGCSMIAIKAVCAVEAPRGGFLPGGEPTILFERHIFSRRTGGRYDKVSPDISNPVRGGYLGGSAEHGRLQRAAVLDRTAALESASWGKFQIMGFNWAACGAASLQAFINASYDSEGAQLDLFIGFVQSQGLVDELRDLRWADFARRYNGADYAANHYDTKLATAYGALKG
jgi:hypothetical protein